MNSNWFPILLLLSLSSPSWGKTAVILSTDVGNEIDDQWAITYMLVNPNFDVKGIISANAPSLPAPSAHSSYRILVNVVEKHLGMLTHPPLFEGSSLPLADKKTARENAGVAFIIETSKQFNKDNRLTILTIGAATDVASAILTDPSITDRISVVAMGFRSLAEGGNEFNIQNDPRAWQAILDSDVPVTAGSGEVCQRYLALTYAQAKEMVSERGAIGAWLWKEYQEWYFRNVKPLRVDDFSKPWIIWDTVVLAYMQGLTTQKTIPRPYLAEDLSFQKSSLAGTITWITEIDSNRLWADFTAKVDEYQRTHGVDLPLCVQ